MVKTTHLYDRKHHSVAHRHKWTQADQNPHLQSNPTLLQHSSKLHDPTHLSSSSAAAEAPYPKTNTPASGGCDDIPGPLAMSLVLPGGLTFSSAPCAVQRQGCHWQMAISYKAILYLLSWVNSWWEKTLKEVFTLSVWAVKSFRTWLPMGIGFNLCWESGFCTEVFCLIWRNVYMRAASFEILPLCYLGEEIKELWWFCSCWAFWFKLSLIPSIGWNFVPL